jgi:uncharacterized damage-inducible protein DinB
MRAVEATRTPWGKTDEREERMSQITFAIEQIDKARKYTLALLDSIDAGDWLLQPGGGVTHVAWQAGHLAIAEYGLALKRVRGTKPVDAELIPAEYATLFGKGSVPHPDPEKYPTPAAIRQTLDRVHSQVMNELAELDDQVLDEPTDPHPMFKTKGEALRFCPMHEFLHAGQIGLLRRMFGQAPLR